MDNKDIFELVRFFDKSSITELEMEDQNTRIRIKKDLTAKAAARQDDCAADGREISAEEETDEAKGISQAEDEGSFIRSPIVGVYYMAPSPESDPFVAEGESIKEGDTMCVIEAMKVMNELRAPFDCIIKKIYVENGQMVEFDQPLFEVEKC